MTRTVVSGAIANKVGNGGEAWVRPTWVEAFRRLGHDVVFVEQFDVEAWGAAAPACIRWFHDVVELFGLGERAVLIDADGTVLAGADAAVAATREDVDLLVNISGNLRWPVALRAARRRVYVDLDPGYTQMWHLDGADLGVLDHDVHVTVGLNVGRVGCGVPTAGLRWLPTLPPVVLDWWPPAAVSAIDRFTTVSSWRGYGRLEHAGTSYGAKVHEWRQLARLPAQVSAAFEIAAAIAAADAADRRLLLDYGWQLADPGRVAGDPCQFAAYVRGSDAELSVAQGVYVATGSGWFSDRSAHYLASGRPVLVQDTGATAVVPADAGIVTFHDAASAAAGVRALQRDAAEHAQAARAFAEAHLDAVQVVGRIAELAGVS